MLKYFRPGIIVVLFAVLFVPALAHAKSPLAVIKSEVNARAYEDRHLGDFEEDWQLFRQSLDASNVSYDVLSDADFSSSSDGLKAYKLIICPLIVDLAPEAVFSLREFLATGGKLLVTDGGGTLGQGGRTIVELAGARVNQHVSTAASKKLMWPRSPLPLTSTFAVGTVIGSLSLAEDGKAVASWLNEVDEASLPAIVRHGNAVYLSWAPGVQGDLSTNAELLALTMEDLAPGVTHEAAVQISFADYERITKELQDLVKRTDEAITTAKQAELAVPFQVIQQHFAKGQKNIEDFEVAYRARDFAQADEMRAEARREFSLAYAQAMPVRPVEARSVWLDRGTIVSTKNPQGLAELFDRLKQAGINIVYFETNNAGFTMYPSQLSPQNPALASWDPLAVAVKEAHKRGMELHSWVWTFAVGNIRHNPIVGRDPDYPGPVLSTHDFSWALAGRNGSLLPRNQSEFWLDPANHEVRRFIKDLTLEITSKYPVDGIQLDYIRYPFNGWGAEMGFDWVGRMKFENETGLSLDNMDAETRKAFEAWKIQQVNDTVRDVSSTLRKARPGLRISAAVYATPRRMRLMGIQQDWETWVKNGWVDTLNPMSYTTTSEELVHKAGYVREETVDKALVYPGLAIRRVDTAGFIEQLDTSREIGTLGTTLFAVAHLDDDKLDLLKKGPYRRQTLLTPQSHPVQASRLLVDDFAALVNRYLSDPRTNILSDQSSTNEVLAELMDVQEALHTMNEASSAEDLEKAHKQVQALHKSVKEWLRLEAFIQRGFRARYIANYLNQVEAILSYAAQRARTQKKIVAER